MKKILLKTLLVIIGLILIFTLTFTAYYLVTTKDYELDESKLVNFNSSAEIYDNNGNFIEESVGNLSVTDFNELKEYTVKAFIAIEDKRFYKHKGIDVKGLIRAMFNNVKSMSFKEGASTISQQLIKNTHLSSDKTLKRKLAEIKLAKQLEKKYTKNQILEKYLNTIYFGNGCYGITSASKRYFGVDPSDLTLNQSAILAAIIKAPSTYSPVENPQKCFDRKNLVLKSMLEQKFISKSEYEENVNKFEEINEYQTGNSSYLKMIKKDYDLILEKTGNVGKKCKIFTYFDANLQNYLENSIPEETENFDKKVIILNKNNQINAYYSTCGEVCRQMGSTIKPLLVYAPAIEENVIDSCSVINDEKTDFSGYSPSNYNDKYYGYVSAKFALAKSLNTCAVKILNSTGIKKSMYYTEKAGIPFTEHDDSLCMALGATEKGATLLQIAAAYSTFKNKGYFTVPSAIDKIITEEGKIIYANRYDKKRVFGEDTAFIINDALRYTVTDGTSKYLNNLKVPICAKTGTVGTENGNTDAYSISYDNDYTIAGWFGKYDGSLMPNNISGGTIPTQTVYSVWKYLIDRGHNVKETFSTDKIAKIDIDKISYEQNHFIERASENTPKRYILQEYFKRNRIPKNYSERFNNPKIENAEIEVNYNEIKISLCLAEYYDFKILKKENGIKTTIYDSAVNEKRYTITDVDVYPERIYEYSILPYFNLGNKIVEGEEYTFQKIKSPSTDVDGSWWIDN